MNGKWKVLILSGVLVFICGFVISFKSFQLNEDFRRQVQLQKSLEISNWISELLIQKVNVLESSVSHLDKSTTETMRRLGVQYFAYAHKSPTGRSSESSEAKWKVKWKNLGDIETPQIKEQVAGFDFDDFSVTKRSWVRLGQNTILISPVANAASEKMKSGFLIFSMDAKRLENLGALSTEVALFSHNGNSLNAKNPKWLEVEKLFTEKKDGSMAVVKDRGTSYLRSASFSKALQMWVVHFQPFPQESYITSASAFIFFVSFLVLGLLASLLTYKLPFENFKMFVGPGRRGVQAGVGESDAVLRVVLHRMRNDLSQLREKVGGMTEPLRKLDVITAIDASKNWLGTTDTKSTKEVSDFGKCLEVITLLKQADLVKAGISVQTQIEDGAAVVCSIEAVEEFILRLIDNSISTLVDEDEKWIHLACTKQGKHYQFVYRDSRSSEIPQLLDDAQLLTSENPFEDIHGILAFGHFAFGVEMTSSQDELNISLKLPVDEPTTTVLPQRPEASPNASSQGQSVPNSQVEESVQATEVVGVRPASEPVTSLPSVSGQAVMSSAGDVEPGTYEIDMDSDYELEDIEILQPLPLPKPVTETQFQPVDFPVEKPEADALTANKTEGLLVPPPLPAAALVSQGDSEVDSMVKDFELKEFNFDETLPEKPVTSDVAQTDSATDWPKSSIAAESKDGLVEFAAGDMKLKIRSPKKRTPNVSS